MTFKRNISPYLSLIFLLLLITSKAKGQDLNLADKPIFVSASGSVQIIFHAKIMYANWDEPNPDPTYKYKITNGQRFILTMDAKSNIGKRYLTVTEGKNVHRLVINYKDDLDVNTEYSYDYSDVAKLAQEVKRLNAIKAQQKSTPNNGQAAQQTETGNQGTGNQQTQQGQTNGTKKTGNQTFTFYEYIGQIDDALNNNNIDDALVAYGKAKQLKPSDDVLDLKLKKINEQRDTKYNDFMTKANTAYNAKNYTEATENYKQASLVKKDEPLPKRMLTKIDAEIQENNRKLAEQRQTDEYNNAMKMADDYLKNKQYENARSSYKNALTIKSGDQMATFKLGQIDRQITEDKKAEEKQRNEDLYNSSIKLADDEYNNGSLEDAREVYTQILKINGHQDDVAASLRIKQINKQLEINKREIERKRNDTLYNSYLKAGDDYFGANLFDEAKNEYGRALQMKNGSDAVASARIKKAEEKVAVVQLEAQLAKEKKAQAEEYKRNIDNADAAFKTGDYAAAQNAYERAMKIGDAKYPFEQTKKIAELVKADKEKQFAEQQLAEAKKNYDDAIGKADEALIKKDYDLAEIYYKKAALIKPNEQYPKDKLAYAQKSQEALLAEKKADADRKEAAIKTAEENKKYDDAIDKADKALLAKDYDLAEAAYNRASGVKPTEQYPKDKLAEIKAIRENSLATAKLNKEKEENLKRQAVQYKTAIENANQLYKNNDLVNARKAYIDAATINTNEKEPLQKVEEIDKKLQALALKKEQDDRYDSLMLTGAQALKNVGETKDFRIKQGIYENALLAYQQASYIKPTEDGSKKMLAYIKNELTKNKAQQAEADSIATVEEQNRKYKDAMAKGEKAKAEKKWDEALAAFNDVLVIRPNDSYAKTVVDNIHTTIAREAEEKKLAAANAKAVTQPASPTIKQQSDQPAALVAVNRNKPVATVPATGNDLAGQPAPRLELQESEIPYSPENLKKEFPGIDFHSPPPGMRFSENSVGNNVQNGIFCNQLLTEKPRLNIQDSTNHIKIICEGINFKGQIMYVKFRVENYSEVPFAVGQMLLTWLKSNGSKSAMLPGFVTILPVVMPQKAFGVIYVTKKNDITADDGLHFEMEDRQKKTKLKLDIFGDVYKKEKDR